MATHKNAGGSLLLWLLLFATAAGLAILLLLTAALVALAQALDSYIWSALAIGGVFAIAATVIYLCFVRRSLAYLHEQAATVYEVARLAKNAYEWVADKVRWFRAIWNLGSEG